MDHGAHRTRPDGRTRARGRCAGASPCGFGRSGQRPYGGTQPVLHDRTRHVLHLERRWRLPARQSGMGARPRLPARGIGRTSLPRFRASRRPRGDERGTRAPRCTGDDPGFREPLPQPGRRLPLDRVALLPQRGADLCRCTRRDRAQASAGRDRATAEAGKRCSRDLRSFREGPPGELRRHSRSGTRKAGRAPRGRAGLPVPFLGGRRAHDQHPRVVCPGHRMRDGTCAGPTGRGDPLVEGSDGSRRAGPDPRRSRPARRGGSRESGASCSRHPVALLPADGRQRRPARRLRRLRDLSPRTYVGGKRPRSATASRAGHRQHPQASGHLRPPSGQRKGAAERDPLTGSLDGDLRNLYQSAAGPGRFGHRDLAGASGRFRRRGSGLPLRLRCRTAHRYQYPRMVRARDRVADRHLAGRSDRPDRRLGRDPSGRRHRLRPRRAFACTREQRQTGARAPRNQKRDRRTEDGRAAVPRVRGFRFGAQTPSLFRYRAATADGVRADARERSETT